MNKKRKKRKNENRIIKWLGFLAIIILGALIIAVTVMIFKDSEASPKENTKKEENTTEVLMDDEEMYSEVDAEYTINTSYGNIVFPEKWKEYVKTEVVEESGYETVQFWVELKGKKPVQVFDIVFGDKGYLVGTIKDDVGKETYVCVESYNTELDDTWTEEEKSIVVSVGHDVNHLLNNLNSLENYVPVE